MTTLSKSLAVLLLPASLLASYDPLALPNPAAAPKILDLSVSDANREREIPIRAYLPDGASNAPVILFSHGLGGSREGSGFLGRHWAGRGYVAVFLQHPGSDNSVWKDKPAGQRMDALREAANLRNSLLRFRDVAAVLDQLKVWNEDGDHPLRGRMNHTQVGMSGHSYGAITTQAVSGQRVPGGAATFTDSRIKAALVLSPSSPAVGSPEHAFGGVKIPWMLMTGTKDISPIGNIDLDSRLAVFPALAPGDKYELVLDGAEHSVFTERALPGESGRRNPNHHRVILALSTAFWDAHLRGDAHAKAWLEGNEPTTVLEPGDRWQKK